VETTILKAKNNLSELLRRVEKGETIVIRRGRRGPAFRIVPHREPASRTLEPNPGWKNAISYRDRDIWETEWREED